MNRSSLLERVSTRILVDDGCWLWTGRLDYKGYGVIDYGRSALKAHRAVYELIRGPIPDGLSLDHLCRCRRCVRPLHLEPVTNLENTRRGFAGQTRAAQQRAKTHCPKGHPYSGRNLHIDSSGHRRCKTCGKWKGNFLDAEEEKVVSNGS